VGKFYSHIICFFLSIDVGNNEYKLFNALFQNYSKSARPVKNWSDALNVDLKLNLKKIASVSENHQTVTIYVRFEAVTKKLFFIDILGLEDF
jgi:hypothetical protein